MNPFDLEARWSQAGNGRHPAWPLDPLDLWIAMGQPSDRFLAAGIRLEPGMVPRTLCLVLN